MPLETALDVAEVMVMTGRAIPAPIWVDELAARRRNAKLESMF